MNVLGIYGGFNWNANHSFEDGEIFTKTYRHTWLHASGATLFKNENHVTSISEERLSRIKYDGNYPQKSIESYKQIWSEDLIHELRTASLLMELGSNLPIETSNKVSPEYLYKIFKQASNRQKVSGLIASDFVELLSTNPRMSPTSLSKIIAKSWESQHDPTRIRLNICISGEESKMNFNPNPVFYGNEHLLSNFFKTIFTWFENEQITVEIEQENQMTMRLSVSIPFNRYLSALQNFQLVNHYLIYISAFYNLRSWITQSTLNIVFPLVMR